MTKDTIDLLSAFQLQRISLLALHFDVDKRGPEDDASVTVTIKTKETSYEHVEDGLVSTTEMIVLSEVTDGEKMTEPHMSLSVSIAVMYYVLCDEEEGDDNLKAELRQRSLKDGYEFVRSQAMQLAGLSPMGRFTLPSIEVAAIA